MKEPIVIVLDCGATNVRAVAVNNAGKVIAIYSIKNNTQPDPFYRSGLIWDVEEIWNKLIQCANAIKDQIKNYKIVAITVTTFGVNGAPVNAEGKLLYPVISWQCQRTAPIMNNIDKYITLQELYNISGVNAYHFNTINTLIWLKENYPEVIDKMHAFLFITSFIIYRLTGIMVNDTTMAGTSMLTDIKNRIFSKKILQKIKIPDKFAELAEPGTIPGFLTKKAASELCLSEKTPVVIAGHDTQFSLIGSGAAKNEVVLNSGTWEIIMARAQNIELSEKAIKAGITNEMDIVPGLFDIGMQWLASGILEWIKNNFYIKEAEKPSVDVYKIMIKEASDIIVLDDKIRFVPDFSVNKGIISGLGLHTTRGHIYRAALHALANKTKSNLNLLEKIGGFKVNSLIIAGGGSKNELWNKIRAKTLGIPLKIVKEPETTVIGAAIVAFFGIGLYSSINEATKAFNIKYDIVNPE